MPVVMQIISLITQLMQALSALFAAIGGGQYLIAKDVAKGWDEAAGGAQKYKNVLLGFDEINRLDDNSGGGGGAGADWANMFEEGELPKWAQWIADHLQLIKDLAIAIGAALAAWKIGSFLSDLLGLNAGLGKLLGVAMAVAGAFLLVKGAIDAFTNGVTWDNLVEMLSGTALLAGGLAIAFGKIGAGIGLIVGGITLIAAALSDFIKKGKLTTEAFYALEAGVLALGAGLALLTGSWIPLAIAALVDLLVAIGTHAEEINTAVDGFFANLMIYHYLPDKTDRVAASALGISPFFVKDYAAAAKRYSAGKTFAIIGYFREIDARLKGINNPSAKDADLWKELIYKIMH